MQSTFEAEAAALLAERLSNVTRFAIVFGAGQTRKNLEVVTRAFDTLTQSDVNEQVYPYAACSMLSKYVHGLFIGCFSYKCAIQAIM